MAANPIYIETEEEIPEVIERVRRTSAEDVPLVLPTRSRFGQSRFNFQLLRQYAHGMGKRISIISPDPAVQQMAEENGFRTFRAVEQYGTPDEAVGTEPVAAVAAAAVELPPARIASRPSAPSAPRLVVAPPARTPSRVATEARPGRLLLYAGAGLLLIAGIVAGALYVPSATVTVKADATPFTADIQVDAAQGQAPVRVRTVSVTKQASASFKATGVKTTPAAVATGQATFSVSNSCDFPAFTLPDGFRIDGGGQQFALKGNLSVSKSQPASGPIIATHPGAAGNVGAGAITTVENSANGCVTVSGGPTSGGADEVKQPQIQTSDIENARSSLDAQVRKDIANDLAKQGQGGEKLADTAIQFAPPDFGADQQVGATVGTFNATMKITAEGAFYSPDDVQKAFTELLAKKVPAGKELTDNKVRTAYDIVNASTGGHLSFKGTASTFVAPSIDRDRLKSQLTARPVAGAKALLATLPIKSATIKQGPFALPFMPLSSTRITIVYEIDQVANGSPNPAPGASPKTG